MPPIRVHSRSSWALIPTILRKLCPKLFRTATPCENSDHTKGHEQPAHESTAIHRLPLELVLEVADYLDLTDVVCLRLSSRRYACLQERKITHCASIADMKDLNERFARDRYRRLADAESPDTTALNVPMCSACRETHPRSCFEEEIAMSPHSRKCIGQSSALRFCEHRYLTYKDVTANLSGCTKHVCTQCPQELGTDATIRLLSYPDRIVCQQRIVLHQDAEAYICSHMQKAGW
jgi:hypothetical protein